MAQTIVKRRSKLARDQRNAQRAEIPTKILTQQHLLPISLLTSVQIPFFFFCTARQLSRSQILKNLKKWANIRIAYVEVGRQLTINVSNCDRFYSHLTYDQLAEGRQCRTSAQCHEKDNYR